MKAKSQQAIFSGIFIIAFTTIASAQSAGPQAMISNLSQPYLGQGAGNFEGVSVGSGYGFAFTTGSSPYALDAVTLEEMGGPGTLQVELLAAQSGVFSAVDQLGNPTVDSRPTQFPGTTSFIDYSPVTPIILSPNTSYIVAAYEPDSGGDDTTLTFNVNSYSVLADWSVYTGITPTLHYSGPNPPSTVSVGTIGQPGQWRRDTADGGLVIEIDATPVPEPNAGQIFSMVIGLLVFCRGLKFRKPQAGN